MSDFRQPPRRKLDPRSSGMLCSADGHFKTAFCLKMGLIGFPETSVTNCQSTLRNIPEERRSYVEIFCCLIRLSKIKLLIICHLQCVLHQKNSNSVF
jgi:hypothetical protein